MAGNLGRFSNTHIKALEQQLIEHCKWYQTMGDTHFKIFKHHTGWPNT